MYCLFCFNLIRFFFLFARKCPLLLLTLVVVEVVVDWAIHGLGQCSHCQVAGASEHQVSVHLHCN
jgi:hypothetical protein